MTGRPRTAPETPDGPVHDVAIVGFGPAGAVAAALLGQAGLDVYVCDRLPGVHEIPRALSMDHEILRLFQQLGLGEAIAAHTEPFTPSEFFGVDGQLIRRMTMVAPPYPQAHTPSVVFTQPPVERALRERVGGMPNVRVELGVALRDLRQEADAVTLVVGGDEGDGGGGGGGPDRAVRARYVIGCDGGASTVRGLVGIALEDLGFDEPWLVVDVLLNDAGLAKLPRVSVQYCEPSRPCTLVIGPRNHRRWEISLNPGEDPKRAATDVATWALLSRWIGPEDGRLWRQASYRFHALVASDWRKGRVFVAGDAAHMQPPFLGQGMCQGIRDAVNLAWKLVSVLRGEVAGDAAEALLDSYGQERKAHVRELTTRLKAIGAVICERDPARARARDQRLLAECGGVVRDTPRQDVLPRLETGFLSGRESTGNGTLFPQPWVLRDGVRCRLDDVMGTGWRLVLSTGTTLPPDRPVPDAAGHDLTVVALGDEGLAECDGVAAQWFGRHGCVAALVRPDHYVFGVARTAGDLGELLEELGRRLGAPVWFSRGLQKQTQRPKIAAWPPTCPCDPSSAPTSAS